MIRNTSYIRFCALIVTFLFMMGANHVFAQTDVTDYETVTVSIPASAYNADAGGTGKGAPQMAPVKYNKTFPLVITSDDMGKTELTNNWAALNGYPVINDHVDLGIQPGGTKFLQAPYKKYYTQGESQDVADHAPMTYTDNVGKTQRYRMTCAVMPYDINSNNYAKINANDAKLMLRTGFSFAQHDVDDASSVQNISTAMTANSTIWATQVGIGLKVMVEPNGNHNYLAAGKQNSGVCWNIFQNPNSEYPGNSKTITDWTHSRTDWSASGIGTMPSTFSNKPTGGFTRTFFQGNESAWKSAVDAANGENIIIGGTHGIGDEIKDHLRTSSNIKDNAWVGSADEVWEYYHIYNNLKIENVNFEGGNLTFDVQVPTYQKNQYRELTLNIPGLTGTGAPTFSTASGKTVPVTGGYNTSGGSGVGYTMNIGLESSITTHINELMAIYRDDQTNEYVKRDLEYLISQLWDGSTYTIQLNANPTYDLTVGSSLAGNAGPTLATIKTDTNGEKSFAVPRYIISDNKLYEHTANASKPYYVNTITTSAGAPSAVTYADKEITGDVVLYAEGEDLDGTSVVGADFDLNDNSSRAYAMRTASMGMGGCIVSGKPATVTNSLPRGKYKLVIGYGDSYTGNSSTYNVCVGGSSIYEFNNSGASNQAVTEFTTGDFDIEVDNTPITITSDYTDDHPEKGSHWIDYVYVVKTADLAAAVPTVTFASSSATTTVKTGSTVTLTATAVPNGGTSLTTAIYAADSGGNKSGAALASGTDNVTYDFTPSSAGTSYFVAESTNSAGTTTSTLITLTAVSIENYTLKIVDKSGGEAMTATLSNPGTAATDPLPDAYRSPFAENYHYYLTAADAQSNNTANALASTNDWSEATIYVGYDVKSTFGSDKKFAVWSNSRYMHMVYRINEAHSSNDYYMTNQKYDISDVPSAATSDGLTQHEITTSNYTLLDNHYMWDLGDDPYNVVFKNYANERYLSSNYNGSPGNQTNIADANRYCIIYWQAKANNSSIETGSDYYRLYDRTKSTNSTLAYNDTGSRFLSCSGDNNNEWRTIDRNHGSYDTFSKIYFKALPEVTVNVLNSHGDVEAQIQAYNNPTATMQSFVPYSMLRAYTSGHAFYYDPAHSDAVTASAVLNTSKLEANGSNLYMTYTINDTKWRTVVKDAVTYYVHSFDAAVDDDANWYGLRYNNGSNYIMASALSSNLGNTSLSNITDTNAETDNGKKGQWALIGTPYHLELANRYLGINNLLGIPANATTSSKAQILAAGTSDVLTTWEVVTYLNQGKSHLFFRPQGGFNAQAPNLFMSTTGGLAAKPGGGEMWDFYWAAKTTEHYAPAATLTLSAAETYVYVDHATTLTATATPASEHSVTYFAIERETAIDTWEVIGTAYSGENVSGTSKDGETGVVTVTCSYSPAAEGTFNFRARAICDNDAENNTILSTSPARDGGIGSVVSITATVAPFVVGSDNYTLKLIDKDGNELFTESNVPKSRVQETDLISGRNADPIADSWRSPLVTRYYYYSTLADARDNTGNNLFDWSSTAATPTVYVGYEVSDAIDLNGGKFSSLNDDANSLMKNRKARSATESNLVRDASKFGKMYLLKFKTSAGYYSEDGGDMPEETETPVGTTVYPYTNGDGPMYIYTDARYQDQKDNGASTRTRWPWFLVSPKGDPYHVYITSWQNSHANSILNTNYYSYLRTFYQEGAGIVTNNVTDDPRTKDGSENQILPTAYMLLRADDSNGTYKLMTVNTISNGTNDVRRTVTSLEQYWRNNPTAQKVVRSTNDNGELTDDEKTTLQNKGWNNYNAYVNAAGWTGGTGSGNKSYTNSEHWFQSIQLGNGSLDIEEVNIDGVLVLLDNHGWEIMRKPIVAKDDPDYESVREELRKFDSPMVKQYKFYSTRNVNHKVYGYHKYDIVTNTGSKTPLAANTRVDADKTITSLADYEPHTSGGALTDLYVTYDVKDEYANSYTGAATEAATAASSFLLRQGSNYAKANGSAITGVTQASADKWYLKPNFNIDAEMGYLYDNGTGNDEPSKETLETTYNNVGWNGFDPYNLRIQNVTTNTYFTTNAYQAAIESGIWTGNGSNVSLGAATTTFDATSYDSRTAKVTNATFMAVQDENGNMRLMPRFDHTKVIQGFTALTEQAAAQSAGNQSHAQTTLLTTPVTYHIIDNSGADVFGALTYEGAGFAVPRAYQSPMVEQYYYHNSLADAQTNRTTSNVNTVSPNDVVYVSYKVSDDFNANKTYNIWGSDNYMHASYRYTQAEDNTGIGTYIWWMRAQAKDREGGNDISTTTLPFLDNTYAWQVGENPDPYNVKFLNKGAHRYINQENTNNNGRMEQLSIIETAGQIPATATSFCILYYGDSSDDCTLYNRTQSKYVYRNDGEWAAHESRTGDNRRLTITELPAISINVVNAANEVECTLEGFYKSGCTWDNSFTPFYLQRIYTSGHTFYYTLADAAAGTNAISGTVNDNTVTTNKAVYVKYTLSSDWGAAADAADETAKKTAQTKKVMPSPNANDKINWYAIRTGNGKYLGATNTNTPTNLANASSANATTDADGNANKLAQWALIGTPYNLKLVDRYHGMSNYLGISSDAAAGSFAFIDDGTADITTWEVCTGFGNNSKLLVRPQRSLNGETPYLYIGWNGGRNNMSLAMSTAGNLGLDLTWVKETDAKTLTFKLYDKDGTYMSPTVSDFALTGVSAGDDLAAAFSHTDLQRRYCQYTFYSSYDEQTQTLSDPVTVAGADPNETVFVKWNYTDDAPVFSTGTEPRDYQYYMLNVTASGSIYPYMIGVLDDGSDGYIVTIDNNLGSVREHKHQFAIVGNPYAFKLYSRYAAQNIGSTNQSEMIIDGIAAHDIVFDMPIPAISLDNNHFKARLKGTERVVTGTANDVWIGSASDAYMSFRDIVIPVHVFKEGLTTQANQMDYREYAIGMYSRSTSDHITDSQLSESGNAIGTAHDFRHAFCDYTFYRGYDWSDGELSEEIPAAGLSYFGGQEQTKRQFFATYTVDHDAFDQVYLIKGSDAEGVYVGKNAASTHGYTLKGVNSKETAKNDDTRSYRWQFTGDPYNLQIVNVGLGDFRNNYPLAVKAVADGSTAESEGAGTLALLTDELPENSSDTEKYGQYSHWEVIDKGDGSYVFWNIDEGEANRYTKSLNRRYAGSGGGVMRMTASEVSLILELPIERYAVNWHVMENDGSNNYSQVATEQVIVDENSTIVVEDMPASLRRHFCEYNNMYSDVTCTTAIPDNSITITSATDIYVPYTLDSGAPEFIKATPTSEIDNKYWYEIHYPGLEKYIYYNNGNLSHNSQSIEIIRDLGDGYTPYRWAMVGTPYSVKFYNKQTESYLTTDGSTLSMSAEGTTFDLMDDTTGELCAIYDEATGMYVTSTAGVQSSNTYYGTSAEFTNTYGVVKIAFVLHYSANTLRQRDSDSDNTLDATAAGTTETITVDTYQKRGKELDDILPKVWKRAFCKYSYDWGTTSTESTASGTTVTNVNQTMVDHYNNHKNEYLYVHVTYDYTTDSPFKWSGATTGKNGYTDKYWYYLVNNHRPSGEQGKMVYRDASPKLRVSTALVQDRLYLNNFEWCVIGDPYGFKILNHYDPDQRYDEYISVTTDRDGYNEGNQLEQVSGNNNCLYEMMPGQYSYNFWIHPIYSTDLMGEDYYDEYSYVGNNSNGSAAIIPDTKKTMSYLRTNASANFRLEIQSDATLAEYVKYAGFVGGLKYDKTTEDLRTAAASGTLTSEQKAAIRELIDDPENIEQMVQGYYRIVPYTQEGGSEHKYIRGYIDEDEKTNSGGMNRNLKVENQATAEYDPASIFWFEGTTHDGTENGYPRYYVRTQGLSMSGGSLGDEAYKCRYENLGAAIMQLKTSDNSSREYLSCTGGATETSTNQCFDEQAGYYKTRLYLQKVNNTNENEMAFKMKLNPGHNGRPILEENKSLGDLPYTYTSIYVPYDLQIIGGKDKDGNEVTAEGCDMVPFIGVREHYYNKKTEGTDTYYDEDEYALVCHSIDMHQKKSEWADSKLHIPAATPVLFRSKSGMTEVSYTIPTDAPSTDNEELRITENMLEGTYVKKVDTRTNIRIFGKESKVIDGTRYYTGRVGLFKRSSTTTKLTNNKIYYVEPERNVEPSQQTNNTRGVLFAFEETGEEVIPTGINNFKSVQEDTIFDLQGRKLDQVTKPGLYIINGRKVVIKKEK